MKTAPLTPASKLDTATIQWFIRYMKALKQFHNQEGYITTAVLFGQAADDLECNILRGNPSTLVRLEGE